MNARIPRRSAFNRGVAALVSVLIIAVANAEVQPIRESGGRAVGEVLKNLLGGKKDKQDNSPHRRP